MAIEFINIRCYGKVFGIRNEKKFELDGNILENIEEVFDFYDRNFSGNGYTRDNSRFFFINHSYTEMEGIRKKVDSWKMDK